MYLRIYCLINKLYLNFETFNIYKIINNRIIIVFTEKSQIYCFQTLN